MIYLHVLCSKDRHALQRCLSLANASPVSLSEGIDRQWFHSGDGRTLTIST